MDVNQNHRIVFAETGILNLKRYIQRNKTVPLTEYLFEELQRLRLREGGKWHTKKFDGISPFQVAGKIAQGIRHNAIFNEVIPEELVSFLNSLAGTDLRLAQVRPQILITPPQKEEWAIPDNGWHIDIAFPSDDVIPGIQAFILLDDIAPRGGATMAIAGSHKFRNLAAMPDKVVEMHGNAGDVYLMDMRIRHAPSINATKKARMILTSRYINPNLQ